MITKPAETSLKQDEHAEQSTGSRSELREKDDR